MPSAEKAEWELRHPNGEALSTAVTAVHRRKLGTCCPFGWPTGLPGSEQRAPQVPMQLGDTFKTMIGLFLPML